MLDARRLWIPVLLALLGAVLLVTSGLARPSASVAAPPAAASGGEADPADLKASLGRYETSLKEVGVLVRELDRLMEHREPCPECGGGGGGRDHPHAIGKSWKAGGADPPDSVRRAWDAALSKLSREMVRLDRAREEYLKQVGELGMKAPSDTPRRKLRMELHGSILRQLLETLRGRLLERYLLMQREVRATISPDEVSKATVPVSKPPAPEGPAAPGGGGGAPASPQPKAPSPDEIARKRKALSDAIREHDAAIGELRGLVERFDELINHRKNCPACGGGNSDRNHEHAVHRTWRDTGGPLPDKVRLESTRVQRSMGLAISAAQKATKVAERLVNDLALDAPADA